MSHNLEINNGQASMFYVGGKPWHGLGTELDNPATAEQAIAAAYLDWEVRKVPLYFESQGRKIQVKNKFAIVREDVLDSKDCQALGIVGKQYTLLQNREAFAFFDPIVGQEAAVYHTAGVLGNGERIWILAKLPTHIKVIGDDRVDKFLLLSNSHDGNSAVQVKFTPIRVVCENTLTMALNHGPTIRIAHTLSMPERLRQAESLLGIVQNRYGQIETVFSEMAKLQVDQERLAEYLKEVFPDPKDPKNEKAMKRTQDNRSWANYFFDQGKGTDIKGVRGTLWAAYNGVTELVDHRQTPFTSSRQLSSIWFGEGYLVKARAFKIAEEKIKVWQN